MLVLITYDVMIKSDSGCKRLSALAKLLDKYGQRVQNSVFECNVDYAHYLTLKDKVLNIIDKEKDSIRIYNLGNNYKNRVEHFGNKETLDLTDKLIF